MFILYSVVLGLAAGIVLGGSPAGLATLRFRWGGVFLVGLLAQVILFSGPVADLVGALGPWLYVASTGAVLVAVAREWRVPGVPVVVAGAAANLAAIVANGGFMPASAGALEALGKQLPAGYSNSIIVAHPALEPLTDIFALPRGMPFANVFSIGDLLIGVGVLIVIAVAMRSRGVEPVPA